MSEKIEGKMKTRDKIVLQSLELFNLHGERNVTTNHIAAHLGISPGNLYYHFRNKQQIVRSIFELYSEELLDRFVLQQEEKDSFSLLEYYMEAIFTLMWKYRFFYSNLPEILQRDPSLHQDYLLVQGKLQSNLVAITENFRRIGLIEVTDAELKALVCSLHLIATNWLNYQITMSSAKEVTEEVILQGMQQMLAVVRPIATEDGKAKLLLLADRLTV